MGTACFGQKKQNTNQTTQSNRTVINPKELNHDIGQLLYKKEELLKNLIEFQHLKKKGFDKQSQIQNCLEQIAIIHIQIQEKKKIKKILRKSKVQNKKNQTITFFANRPDSVDLSSYEQIIHQKLRKQRKNQQIRQKMERQIQLYCRSSQLERIRQQYRTLNQ